MLFVAGLTNSKWLDEMTYRILVKELGKGYLQDFILRTKKL